MARPIKIGLDYFPLDVNIDDNIELIEAEHGLSGFAIIIKLWQKIYSNGYYIEWNDDVALLFSRKINSDITLINSVINSCFKRNLFDEKLNKKYNILTSSGIQKRFISVSSQAKRKTISVIKEYLLVNSEFTNLITELTTLNTEFSTQSKEKESKENNIGDDIEIIYKSYPSICPIKNSSTNKSKKDKEKIKKILGDISKDELLLIINKYISDCKKSNTYIKNFKTFLNNLPDYELPIVKKIIDDGIERFTVLYDGDPKVYKHTEEEIKRHIELHQTRVRSKK